jgi:hypothetical protein
LLDHRAIAATEVTDVENLAGFDVADRAAISDPSIWPIATTATTIPVAATATATATATTAARTPSAAPVDPDIVNIAVAHIDDRFIVKIAVTISSLRVTRARDAMFSIRLKLLVGITIEIDGHVPAFGSPNPLLHCILSA